MCCIAKIWVSYNNRQSMYFLSCSYVLFKWTVCYILGRCEWMVQLRKYPYPKMESCWKFWRGRWVSGAKIYKERNIEIQGEIECSKYKMNKRSKMEVWIFSKTTQKFMLTRLCLNCLRSKPETRKTWLKMIFNKVTEDFACSFEF